MTYNDFYEKWARFNIPILIIQHYDTIHITRDYIIYIDNWNLLGYDLSDNRFLGTQPIIEKTIL